MTRTKWAIREDRNSDGEIINHYRSRVDGDWLVTQRRKVGETRWGHSSCVPA